MNFHLFFLLYFVSMGHSKKLESDPEIFLLPEELIMHYQYPVEVRTIQTEDGYLLTCYRIPHGRKNDEGLQSRTPFLLVHPGVTSVMAFLSNQNNSIAFLLADAGFDVWILSSRGTDFSSSHIRFSSDDPQYWNFSLDEIGLIDVPSAIDTVIHETNLKPIVLGYSNSGLATLMALSNKTEYNDKIQAFFTFGTSVYKSSPKEWILRILRNHWKTLDTLHPDGKFPSQFLLGPLKNIVEIFILYMPNLIKNLLIPMIVGYNPFNRPDNVVLEMTNKHFPSSCGRNVFQHIGQILNHSFAAFDFGPEGNMRKYGLKEPPRYNLTKVTAKVAIFWGSNDILVLEEDVQRSFAMLSNVILKYRVPYDLFTHDDFMWGKYAKELLYDKIIEAAKNLSKTY